MSMDTPASEAGLRWDRVLQSRELRARLTFTIGALLLWRLLHLVPLPGIDPEVMAATLSRYGMINHGNVIALGLTPFVAVWGLSFNDVLFNGLWAGLNPMSCMKNHAAPNEINSTAHRTM